MATSGYEFPARRNLQVFAFDPMRGRTAGNRLTLGVPFERLVPGPLGQRVQVIDFDGSARVFYEPVDLEDPAVLMNDGLSPSESDPRFHQQMAYAVTMSVVETFESALGRKLAFRKQKPLRLFPHAFEGANAFYDRDLSAVLFGYFKADERDPGPNLPGQTVFTCLSHDIIAHEVTHALVDRLKPHLIEASNPDVYGFHEGFADLVAIFQHFTLKEVLTETIQKTRGDLRSPGPLAELAQQFGYSTGRGRALRTAIDKPDPSLYRTATEPHERGSILVAAVFDAFFAVYQQRIQDLIRIATGGTGRLPEGYLHPDLVNRIASEAAKTARNVLTMCVRAFEYLPPVDVTYSDFLRAVVTADFETVPADERGLRAELIEAFRLRGVYPEGQGVVSLAEESLLWKAPNEPMKLPFDPSQEALVLSAQAFDRGPRRGEPSPPGVDERKALNKWAGLLGEFASGHRRELGLDPVVKPHLEGFHTVFRFSPEGRLVVELVAQFVQEDRAAQDDPAFGGVKVLGGTTVIASVNGDIRYVIAKPLTRERRQTQLDFAAACDREDPMLACGHRSYEAHRLRFRNFARLHAAGSR
ncbi:MAG: hypothetical protein NEA02_09170 [Thermoanaerobaculia bacterium]|nr:hypothetical protein [Thermoanaerobaculia bacterium]